MTESRWPQWGGGQRLKSRRKKDGHDPVRVFVSYRRTDAPGSAVHLAERLAERFGDEYVFFDVETIPPGVDFQTYIRTAVGSCDVLLVVIGPRWLFAADDQGRRRLDNPDDFVRLEIEYALDANCRVIPVLVEGAMMPSQMNLPEPLARLAYRQAVELTHAHWRADFEGLAARLSLPRPRRFGRWGDIKRLAPLGPLLRNALRRPSWANVAVPLCVMLVGIVFHRWWLIPVAIASYLAFASITLFDLHEARQVHERVRQVGSPTIVPHSAERRR